MDGPPRGARARAAPARPRWPTAPAPTRRRWPRGSPRWPRSPRETGLLRAVCPVPGRGRRRPARLLGRRGPHRDRRLPARPARRRSACARTGAAWARRRARSRWPSAPPTGVLPRRRPRRPGRAGRRRGAGGGAAMRLAARGADLGPQHVPDLPRPGAGRATRRWTFTDGRAHRAQPRPCSRAARRLGRVAASPSRATPTRLTLVPVASITAAGRGRLDPALLARAVRRGAHASP